MTLAFNLLARALGLAHEYLGFPPLPYPMVMEASGAILSRPDNGWVLGVWWMG